MRNIIIFSFITLIVGLQSNVIAGEPPTSPYFEIESGTHNAAIYKIATDAGNRFLVTAAIDKTIRVWSLSDGKLLRTLRPPIGDNLEGRPLAVAISPDGKTIACGGVTGHEWDGAYSVYLFEQETGVLYRRITGIPATISHLAFSYDGRYLAVALRAKGIRIYSSMDWSLTGSDNDYDSAVTWVDFDAKSSRLATTGSDGFIRLYKLGTLATIEKFKPYLTKTSPGEGNPSSLAFSPDGGKIAVGYDRPHRVDIISADTLSLIATPYFVDTSDDFMELHNVAWSLLAGSVVPAGSGKWRMYFSEIPSAGTSTGIAPRRTFSATSDDLLTWTVDAGVRIGPGASLSGSAEHPCAIVNSDGSISIFYFRNSNISIMMATSTDGINFTTETTTGLSPANDPDVVKVGGKLRMYYNWGNDTNGTIYSATKDAP